MKIRMLLAAVALAKARAVAGIPERDWLDDDPGPPPSKDGQTPR